MIVASPFAVLFAAAPASSTSCVQYEGACNVDIVLASEWNGPVVALAGDRNDPEELELSPGRRIGPLERIDAPLQWLERSEEDESWVPLGSPVPVTESEVLVVPVWLEEEGRIETHVLTDLPEPDEGLWLLVNASSHELRFDLGEESTERIAPGSIEEMRPIIETKGSFRLRLRIHDGDELLPTSLSTRMSGEQERHFVLVVQDDPENEDRLLWATIYQ